MSTRKEDGPHRMPPEGRRFGPGNLGRRGGRMKGARNVRTIVQEIAREGHKVRIEGRIQTLTTAELVVLALSRKAMAGDVRAVREIDRLRDRHGPVETTGGVLVVPGEMSPEEWSRRAEIQNRFRKRPPTMDEAAGYRRPDPAI